MALEHGDLSRILETTIVAARLAGQMAMEEMNFITVSIKNGNELVTQADGKCQQKIIDTVKETFPDAGFIAEEGQAGGIFKLSARSDEALWWVIDPIDGTDNFAHGILAFCVSIAVIYQGEPVVGVIFDPATDSMFTAVKDSDAQLNGRRITANDDQINKFSSVGIDSHLGDKLPAWASEVLLSSRCRNLGSTALQIAYVAKGSLVATIHCFPKLWDIAAASLIAESAGAMVTNWQGQRIFPMDLEAYQGGPLKMLAANKKVHPKLLQILK